jgi:PKD repeat protein
MKFFYLVLASLLISVQASFAQGLEGIIVERFYETDAADEANALDNGSVVPLPVGSVVYRVFVDMADGYKFSQLFGTLEHPLSVNATAEFYNDPSYGVTVNPATISANNIRKHTALIDSWFTTGGASNGKVGVLKIEDTDGSVGNQHNVLANNPGGCYGVPINGTDAQDGMTLNSPTTYLVPNSLGVGGALEALDQTAGSSVYIDGGAIAALGGIVGPTATNRVMIAQFTVNGDITFALNVQLVNATTGAAENYVASNPIVGELTHPTLTYNSNIAPTITITAPSNGSTIGFGDYTLTANAGDEQGYVTSVEFFVDGVSVGVDNTAPYEVVYNATVGSHTITATAIDGDCLTGNAQSVSVSVSSNSAPAVTLDAPTIAVEGSSITLSSTASDSDGSITQVEFFVDGVSVGTDATSPYSVVWVATLGANQTITAVATDDSGLSTTSNTVLITVNGNNAPTVSITFPFSTSDFTAPEMVALTAEAFDADGSVVSVEFFINGELVGTATSTPFIVNWMSVAGPAEIVAVATDSNGAQTTSVSVNLEVLDPSTEPYAVGSITQTCDVTEFCVPISVSAAFPVSGVIGYDITMNYDPNDLEPTGTSELFSDLIDGNLISATVTVASAGVAQVMITLNGNAPSGTQFQGYGDLICVRFSRLSGLGANDSTEVSVSSVIESYVSGPMTASANSAFQYSQPNTFYSGNITTGESSISLGENESNASATPQTLVYGSTNGAVNNPAAPSVVEANGSFMHDLNNGLDLVIERDIDNTASIQKTVNGADVLLAKALLNGSYTPTIFEILAMDVNMDGTVTAGDISQMNQRATLMIGEYQQAWNTTGQPAKDWIFVDAARLSEAAFAISASFPDDDGVGFSALRVPAIPFALPTAASDFNPNSASCQQWASENYKAIFLGDVNASYGLNLANSQDSILFDLSQAVYTSDGASNFIEVPMIAQFAGNDVRSFDAAFKFNQNKLAYNSSVAIAADLELVSAYNVDDEYARLIATRNTSESILDGAVVAHVKFEILDECSAVFSTDFNSISTWLNGEVAGYRFIDGATLPDPIQLVSAAPYCVGSPIELSYADVIDGNVIETYDWQFGDGSVATGQEVSVSITAPGATPITLSMTAANGCTYQVAGEVFVSTSPVASFSYTFDTNTSLVTFDNTSTISSGNIATYNWNFGDNNTSTDADPTYTYASSGTYTVTLTAISALGCSSSYETQVNASVGVEELVADFVMQVYPNPAEEKAFVISSVKGVMVVVDQAGRKVLEGASITPNIAHMIDSSTWAEGMYQVVLTTPTGSRTTRLVKVN